MIFLDLLCLPLTLLIVVTVVRVRPVLSTVRQCTVEPSGGAAESGAAESDAAEAVPVNLHLVAAG